MKTVILSVCIWIAILIAPAQQQSTEHSTGQQPTTSTPKAQTDLMPQEKVLNPGASAGAQQKTKKNSVGKGALTVTAAQPVAGAGRLS
jgi:hypothetical protein